MAYPVYPTVPHPCGGPPLWTPPENTGNSSGLGLYLQDADPANPPLILFDMTKGGNGNFVGDFVVSGTGTRNTGDGNIKFFLPPKVDAATVQIRKAWLIVNTYVSDMVSDPTALEPYVLKHQSDGSDLKLTGGFAFWCSSTCWLNPPPVPMTETYLRNRIYAWDVTAYVLNWLAGNYAISGLPNNPTMPLGTDGDRLPGCASSQGAILFAIYEYVPVEEDRPHRYIQGWLGARLMASGLPWGGVEIEDQTFDMATGSPLVNYTGNAKVTLVAGDTQTIVDGDRANVNNTNFLPSNNAFKKIGSSLSVITQNMSNIYANAHNKIIVETSNDCISWFFFAISADTTQPKANFNPVFCVSTKLREDIDSLLPGTIEVVSNLSITPPPPNCFNTAVGQEFPPSPFYIRIDKEILLVASRESTTSDPTPGDWTGWNVIRGAGGTTPALHAKGACVKLVMPVEAKSQMQAALARRGRPRSRPGPGRLNGGNIKQGF
jgi:hypothetical protein